MAVKKTSTDSPPAPQTPADLADLAMRLRDHAGSIRNPAARSAWGEDMLAAADVIDGTVSLYRDVQSGESDAALRAVLRLFPAKEG